MARKRRKASSQRRRPARSRDATRGRTKGQAARSVQGPHAQDVAVSESDPVDSPTAAVTPAANMGNAGADLVSAQPPAASKERASWPTRRKRSQMVELPVEELDHVRSDLARIGVLSLGMVVILVVLTFVLR